MLRSIASGLAAGAAGTTTLNAVTYVDMSVRARPSSSTPEDTVAKLADAAGVQIPGDDDERENRKQGLGPLTGILAGVGTGALLGLARHLGWRPNPVVGAVLAGALAMAGADGPMAALGISDPRTWAATDWLADVVPHLAYGAVTHATLAGLEP